MMHNSKFFLFCFFVLILFSCGTEETPEPEKPENEADLPANVLAVFENLGGGYFGNQVEVWFWATDANNTILDYAKKEGDAISLQRPNSFTGERITVHILAVSVNGEYSVQTYNQIKPKRFVFPNSRQNSGEINLNLTGIPSSASAIVIGIGGQDWYSASHFFRNFISHVAFAQTDNVFYASWLDKDVPHYKLVENLLPGTSQTIDLAQNTTSGIKSLPLSLQNQPHQIGSVHISANYTTTSGNKRFLRAFRNSFPINAAPIRTTTAYLPEFLTEDYNLWITARDASRPDYDWSNRYKSHTPGTVELLESAITVESKDPSLAKLQTAGSHDFAILTFVTEYVEEDIFWFYNAWKIYGNKSFTQPFPSLPAELAASHPNFTAALFKRPDSYYLAMAEDWSILQNFDEYMSNIFGEIPFSPLEMPANESQREILLKGAVE